MFDDVILPVVIGGVVGAILLILEYKTGWFARTVHDYAQKRYDDKIETTRLELTISKIKWVLTSSLFSVLLAVILMSLIADARVSYLEAVIDGYEQSQEWQLPEAIHSLRDASAELTLSLQEHDRLSELEVLVPELEADKTQLEAMVEQLRGHNTSLQTKIESLEAQLLPSERVEIIEGEAVPLMGQSNYLGVHYVYPGWIDVTWNNRSENLHVGQSLSFIQNEHPCVVTLVDIDEPSKKVVFEIGCEQ